MKTSNTRAIRLGLLAAAMTLLGASPALADAFSEYQTNGKNYTFNWEHFWQGKRLTA